MADYSQSEHTCLLEQLANPCHKKTCLTIFVLEQTQSLPVIYTETKVGTSTFPLKKTA